MTTDTPIQFPDDDRTLLRQMFVIVQNMDSRLANVEDRLTKLETIVDERLHDTKPIWESVLKRLDGIEQEQRSIKIRLEKIETEFRSLRQAFMSNSAILNTMTLELERRVAELEKSA